MARGPQYLNSRGGFSNQRPDYLGARGSQPPPPAPVRPKTLSPEAAERIAQALKVMLKS